MIKPKTKSKTCIFFTIDTTSFKNIGMNHPTTTDFKPVFLHTRHPELCRKTFRINLSSGSTKGKFKETSSTFTTESPCKGLDNTFKICKTYSFINDNTFNLMKHRRVSRVTINPVHSTWSYETKRRFSLNMA